MPLDFFQPEVYVVFFSFLVILTSEKFMIGYLKSNIFLVNYLKSNLCHGWQWKCIIALDSSMFEAKFAEFYDVRTCVLVILFALFVDEKQPRDWVILLANSNLRNKK